MLFLGDYRDEIEQQMLAQWRAGTVTLAQEHEARGRAAVAGEIADLQWDAIKNFYEGSE
ncbi:conserved hypothetical protein [Gluconacetobacter diazotrophicus PA1 5]|nr:conserved hypothetical protein [Gluconacetobacter diazotrophicus PA1 5]TWB00438.1 hypothetical protein FBZ86_13618 [Gluconacetobacter diazotrophicus]